MEKVLRRTEKDVEESIKIVFNTVKSLVTIYNMVLNRDSDMYDSEEFVAVEDVEVPQNTKLNIMLEKDELHYEYILTHHTYTDATVARILKNKDDPVYRIDIHLSGKQKPVSILIPPYSIFDAVYMLTNRELIEYIAKRAKIEDLNVKVSDIYTLAEIIISSKSSPSKIGLEADPSSETLPVMVVDNIGRVLNRLSIWVYYDSSADKDIYSITAHMNVKGDRILYYIPDHEWEEYIDSFTRLLIHLEAEKDIERMGKLVDEYLRLIQVSYLLIDAYNVYSDEYSDEYI